MKVDIPSFAFGGVIVTLAAWGAWGWGVLAYSVQPFLALLVCPLFLCIEVASAFLLVRLSQNWAILSKRLGLIFLVVLFGAINTVSTKNAWTQFEHIVLADAREADMQPIYDAKAQIERLEAVIDALPMPDPNTIAARQEAARKARADRLAEIIPRIEDARRRASVTPEPRYLIHPNLALILFILIEIAKFIGLYALAPRTLTTSTPDFASLTPSERGRLLAQIKHNPKV